MAESPGQALSLGKTLRLARLFDPDSGTAIRHGAGVDDAMGLLSAR